MNMYSEFAVFGTPDCEKEERFYDIETNYSTCLDCGNDVEQIDIEYCNKCLEEMNNGSSLRDANVNDCICKTVEPVSDLAGSF